MTIFRLLGIWLLATAQSQPSVPARSQLDEIKTQCSQRCSKFHSLTGKIRIETETTAQGLSTHAQAAGTYEHLFQDGKLLFRVDLNNKVTQSLRGQSGSAEQSVSTISDGRYAYTLSTQAGQPPTAIRSIPKPAQTVLADEAFFTSLMHDYRLDVLPDEEVDGKAAWVIEAKPKVQIPGQTAKTIYYILKDSGIRVRSTGHDATGKRVQLTELTDIRLDTPVKPDRFVFKAPPGVRIVDLSKKL